MTDTELANPAMRQVDALFHAVGLDFTKAQLCRISLYRGKAAREDIGRQAL